MMRRFVILAIALSTLSMIFPMVSAVEDNAVFMMGTEIENVESNYILQGQYSSFCLEITLGYNISSWSVEVNSDSRLLSFINGTTNQFLEAGQGIGMSIDINPEASFGLHEVIVLLNYTKTSGEKVSKRFDLTVEFIDPLDIIEVHLPEGTDREISLSVRTFIPISNLTVMFGGDGDVWVEDESITLREISPGNYTYDTKIYYGGLDSIGGQQFSWHVVGHVDNRSFEFSEYNIPADIDWRLSERKSSFTDWMIFFLNGEFLIEDDGSDGLRWYMATFWVILIIIIIIGIILLVMFVRKRNKEKGAEIGPKIEN
jgi:hypothetical protein